MSFESDNANVLPDNKLITCIVPKGQGKNLVDALFAEKSITAANVASGRGVSERTSKFAEEVDILTVSVSAVRADEIFDFLYHRIDLDHSLGRFMYQSALSAATALTMPELPMEETD